MQSAYRSLETELQQAVKDNTTSAGMTSSIVHIVNLYEDGEEEMFLE